MIKRIVRVVIFLLIVTLSSTEVSANSGPPVVGITISPNVCDLDEETYESIFPGNIDILVRVEDFDEGSFVPMTDQFKSYYPFYEDIDYLDEIPTGWTSFSAYYVKEYKWGNLAWVCGMEFGDDNLVKDMKYIRVVYFDDDGNTLFTSEDIKIPNVFFYQDMDSLIYLNTDNNTIETDIVPHTNPYLFLVVISVLALILYSVLIEVIVAVIFKLKNKKAILNILLINLVTQVVMYVYFFVIFDSFESRYYLHLFIYEIIVLIVEFAYLYWRLKPSISWKRLALYVLISNVVSYLLGLVRHF